MPEMYAELHATNEKVDRLVGVVERLASSCDRLANSYDKHAENFNALANRVTTIEAVMMTQREEKTDNRGLWIGVGGVLSGFLTALVIWLTEKPH